ncbi:hypothetical protein [Candidatus Enterococcus mansonii]|uniref:DUF5105 domain-containing protein n=1 Tax=Candidatus Enterococcus mansonii TaxID=1834181 RepID=A0A242CGT6_9ENTE|nr:hypothetical protein [Enterococcus sp. 4G2_DIV0659]OTO09447.1 hypothetical protein A5880_000126 [Enterococcus sp. 4G2_DIV0659]
MKNKRIIIMLAFAVVIFAGCQKNADPKDVAAVFVNNIIYDKDHEKAETYFYQLDAPGQAELIEDFSELFELSKEQAKELVLIYQERLEKETKFSVKIKDSDKKRQKVDILVTGLDQKTFDQNLDKKADEELVQYLKNKGYDSINQLDDIDKISDEQQLNNILKELNALTDKDLNQIQFEALKKAMKELKASNESKTIHLELEPDKKEKKYWKIIDEEERFTELLNAFQG